MRRYSTSADGESDKTDLRIVKTRTALVGALRELLSEKGIDKITVVELCERAQVRKATFYAHFRDKEDLFTYFVQTIQADYRAQLDRDAKEGSTLEYCAGAFAVLLAFLEDNEAFAGEVLRSSTRNLALDTLMEETKNDLHERFECERRRGASLPGDPALLASMCAGAIVYSARWWIETDPRPSRADAARQFAAALASLAR